MYENQFVVTAAFLSFLGMFVSGSLALFGGGTLAYFALGSTFVFSLFVGLLTKRSKSTIVICLAFFAVVLINEISGNIEVGLLEIWSREVSESQFLKSRKYLVYGTVIVGVVLGMTIRALTFVAGKNAPNAAERSAGKQVKT